MNVTEPRWFRYIKHSDVTVLEAAGWRVCELAGPYHHDAYSTIMEWTGPGEPPNGDSQQDAEDDRRPSQ